MNSSLSGCLALGAAALTLAAGTAPQVSHHLVACAPGYAGTSAQAQSTMDDFAAMVAAAAGWEAGSLTAEYQESKEVGVGRIEDARTDLAILPLPLFLESEEALGLRPLLQVVQASGSRTETWSLVAATGRITGPASLVDWEIVGIPAYAPAFVRGPILASWGEVPSSTRLTFNRRVLGSLRRAAAGEPLAVILDSAQVDALPSLPRADALEIVAVSAALPAAVVVSVGDRMAATEIERLVAGLLVVDKSPEFASVLGTLRLTGFAPVDEDSLRAARQMFLAAR